MSATRLACTVRGCGAPLARGERTLRCPAGHAFDVAREGYVNLAQPQDRRSRAPGEPAETVAARRRLAELGVDRALADAVAAWADELGLARDAGVCDVGCGTGAILAALAAARPLDAYGVDLTVASIRAAARARPASARAQPGPTWVVANVERGMPFVRASLAAVTSIKGPKPFAELARVLAPDGHLLVAVPHPADLAELRVATAGGALARDPAARALEHAAPWFTLRRRWSVRERRALAPEVLRDLLAVAYRGARASEAGRALELEPLAVTLAATLLWLRPRATSRAPVDPAEHARDPFRSDAERERRG